jgi:DNA-binding transcriptional MerR regulator
VITTSKFSISDLERITGVKAHTIRIWEKRYKGLTPGRSQGNTRYYDDAQLVKLLNVMSLLECGHKVSKLFSFSDQEIKELLEKELTKTKSPDEQIEFFITQLLSTGIHYDEARFQKLITESISKYGFVNAFMHIVFPLLNRIGLLWGKDNLCPSKEHFISNIVRQKLIGAIELLPEPKNLQKPWILLLPENEYHEIGLIFSNYIIRLYGHRTIFLGANVPVSSLENTLHVFTNSKVLFFTTQNQTLEKVHEYIKYIRNQDIHSKIIIAGNPKWTHALSLQNVIQIGSLEELEREIKA